jgi:hypothetical protein
MKHTHLIAAGLVLFGVALHSYIELVEATSSSFPFWLWSIFPYVLGGLLVIAGPFRIFIGALTLIAVADLLVFRSIFIHPTSSTAPIALIFMPLWSVLVIGPVGAALGWLFGWLARKDAERAKGPQALLED